MATTGWSGTVVSRVTSLPCGPSPLTPSPRTGWCLSVTTARCACGSDIAALYERVGFGKVFGGTIVCVRCLSIIFFEFLGATCRRTVIFWIVFWQIFSIFWTFLLLSYLAHCRLSFLRSVRVHGCFMILQVSSRALIPITGNLHVFRKEMTRNQSIQSAGVFLFLCCIL